MADLARLSINQATTRAQHDLAQAVHAYAAAGVPAIGVWRDKLAACGVAAARRLIDDAGLAVSSLCRGGMFPAVDAAGRLAALDDNRRAVDEAAALGTGTLVIVAGGLPGHSKNLADARRMVADGLAALLPHARAAGVTLAIEPLHPMYAADRCCINTLAQALDLAEALGDGVGDVVDVYHVWWDPDLTRQIARAAGRIAGFHVCDWLVPTTDLLLDRGMMGDGVIDLKGIAADVAATGYAGPIEVEIFSAADWWRRPGDETVAVAMARFRDCV